MNKKQLALLLVVCLYIAFTATVYALPPDEPTYWTDDFSKDDVYAQTTIFNANWTYTQTQNFTETVSDGLLSIKYATLSSSPGQFFKIWRGVSKNEKGIQVTYKVSKTSADTLQLALSADGSTPQYFVEFGWTNDLPAIRAGFINSTGTLEYSDVLGNYSYSVWYSAELTYKTPAQFSVKVSKQGDYQNVLTFNTTDVRHEATELWATCISAYGISGSGGKTTYFYVDYASFSAPGGTIGDITGIVYATLGIAVVVGILGASMTMIKRK